MSVEVSSTCKTGMMTSLRQSFLNMIGAALFYSGGGILVISSICAVHRITGLMVKGMDSVSRSLFPITAGYRRIDQPAPIVPPLTWGCIKREAEDCAAIYAAVLTGIVFRAVGVWFLRGGSTTK